MQGDRQESNLYMEQPREGLDGVQPWVLIRILKGVFGLATAPRHWWTKLNRVLQATDLPDFDGTNVRLVPNPLDPAMFTWPRRNLGCHRGRAR